MDHKHAMKRNPVSNYIMYKNGNNTKMLAVTFS